MSTLAKTICCVAALAWIQGAGAGEVVVSDQGGSIVLSAESSPDAVQPASAPAGLPVSASTGMSDTPSQVPDGQGAAPVTRVPVKAYYEKVDRANIEKRMEARAARTMKRKAEAEKDAAERAAKAQISQPQQDPVQQGPDVQSGQ